ncbi:serine hydrolase domain-containing protein [Crossiella cryophila]|uniref:CubicO group peptidase (Beta-lactamase class C family) n=1 Tax=Crossiella cryophila TaxID=43355 RepID=A0A7W7FX95_9PSEU|nr:serine hydrolase domain-containing protein [Crossiella cryophila]MBB4678684.1 CubicO group peptidase (beta-lactamase class C family) [Crossiella cryophila]
MRGRIRQYVLVLVLGLAGVLPAAAVPGPELTKRMDERMDKALERAAGRFGAAGVQAVAIRRGQVVWSGVRGLAVISPPREVGADTMFAFASLSKLMLTPFALHQAENGVLDLDKPISAYLGDDLPGARVVTVRMLLTHTTGYPDVYADPATEPLFPPGDRYDPNRPYTFEMLRPAIREPANPGANFHYSNTGYLVLGHLLTTIAGGDEAFRQAYRDFLRRAGTPRAPLTEQQVTAERSPQALQRFAHGYTRHDNGSLTDFFTAHGARGIPTDLYGLPFTDGLLAGTAMGAGLVLDALFTRGNLLRPETLRHMVTPTPQALRSQDFERSYGMGTYRTKTAGGSWQGHGGSYVGCTAMAGTDRDRGLTIAVVVNQNSAQRPAEVIWRELAEASGGY